MDATGMPETLGECEAMIEEVKGAVTDIDNQFISFKAGTFKPEASDWHQKALSAKAHYQRRLSALKAERIRLRDKHLAKAGQEKEQRRRETEALHEANRQKKNMLAAKKLQALQNWAWDNFPERRDEIAAVIAAVKEDTHD